MNVINIDLESDYDCINAYDNNRISKGLHDYLRNYNIDLSKDVVINVNLNSFELKREKKFIKNILINDFSENLNDINIEKNYLNVRDAMLVLAGFIFVFMYTFLQKCGIKVLDEFFLVVGWVCLWEVAESFLFKRRKLNYLLKKYKKYMVSEIEIK